MGSVSRRELSRKFSTQFSQEEVVYSSFSSRAFDVLSRGFFCKSFVKIFFIEEKGSVDA